MTEKGHNSKSLCSCFPYGQLHNITRFYGKWTLKFKSFYYFISHRDIFIMLMVYLISYQQTWLETGTFSCPLAINTTGIMVWVIY